MRVRASGSYEDSVLITVLTSAASDWAAATLATPPFPFAGFFAPVDNAPIVNVAKPGSAVPVKFSLGGDEGLDIFADGSPVSIAIDCGTGLDLDQIEQTVTLNESGLRYDPATGRYTYVWKTPRAWTGCRRLQLELTDGSTHVALFRFR